MQRYYSLLRTRPQFRKLWIAQVISLTGDWFSTIAIVILVNRYAPSNAAGIAISGLFLARTLPVFFASPFAGAIADRFDRKFILVASNWLRVFVVLGFLLVDSQDDVWLVYVLTVLQFLLSAFFEPAYAAILPSLVERDDLLSANTLGSVTWSVMLTLGSAIGGVITALFGVEAAIVLDGLTFFTAGLVILSIKPRRDPPPEEVQQAPDESYFAELSQGYRYLRQHPNIGVAALVKGLVQIGTIDVMIAVYAAQVFVVGDEGATTLGILFTAHGVGAILGPLWGDIVSDGSEAALKRWLGYGFLMIALGWLVFGLGPSLFVVTLGMVLRGMGGSIGWTYSTVLLQMQVPDKYLGRVFGVDFTFFNFMLALATIFAGFALDGLGMGPRELVVLVAVGSIAPWLFWIGWVRRQKRQPLVSNAGD